MLNYGMSMNDTEFYVLYLYNLVVWYKVNGLLLSKSLIVYLYESVLCSK